MQNVLRPTEVLALTLTQLTLIYLNPFQATHAHAHAHANFISPTTQPLPNSAANTDYDTLTMTTDWSPYPSKSLKRRLSITTESLGERIIFIKHCSNNESSYYLK
jgi:hypothetical protein